MTELSDYNKFSEGPLVFPINGKKYVLPEVSIPDGLALAGAIAGKDKAAGRKSGESMWRLILGPLWDEMIADGVPLAAATRVGITALADRQYGREFANVTWETGADPKALQPYLEATAPTNRAQRRLNSTGGEKKIPSPVSTKATTSRLTSKSMTKTDRSSGKTS